MVSSSISYLSESLKPRTAVAIVFLSNFCVMVLELVAGRLLAPTIGVNLYTWTSIIGVILAGISLGNYLGGRIADRSANRRVLAIVFILSAFASLSVLWVIDVIGAPRVEVSVIVWILLTVAAIFLFPSAILGMISPIVVKLTLTNLDRAGNTVGRIYAAGAAGSIFGTFVTGFYLISWFGTRAIVVGVALTLMLLGVLLIFSHRRRLDGPLFVATAVFVGMVTLTWQQSKLESPCIEETNYFCIQVIQSEENNQRLLVLDRLLHSIVDMDNPTELVYVYEQIYGEVVTSIYPTDGKGPDTLFLGGGGYIFPRFIEENYADTQIEVVEIDPVVTKINYTALGLSQNTRIVSYNKDARQFFIGLNDDVRYDVIFGDTFNDVSVPYHLTTLEFNEIVAQHLTEDGVYLVNIIDGHHLQFVRAYVNTLRQTFSEVHVSSAGIEPGTSSRQTFVIVATNNSEISLLLAEPPLAKDFLSPAQLETYMQGAELLLLTDDFVPVDNLLVPVLQESDY